MILFVRCINGSTALHTAAYFGIIPVVKDLLNQGVDINLLDYKGATALHRARDVETMHVSDVMVFVIIDKVILAANVDVAEDV